MKLLNLAAMSATAAMLFASGCAYTSDAPMTAADHQMMRSCSSMSPGDRMDNPQCVAMMNRMSMSQADMNTMNSCMGMSHDDMMRREECRRIMEMHPGAMNMPH